MKLKKQLYWIGLGVVLAVVLALFIFEVAPDWFSKIPAKKIELVGNPDDSAKFPGVKNELETYSSRPFATAQMCVDLEKVKAGLENTSEQLIGELQNKNKGLFMSLSDDKPKDNTPRNSAEFIQSYGGKDTEFRQNYGKAYRKMLDDLSDPKSALKLKVEKGSDGGEVIRNYQNEAPENILKKFNIQRAIVSACNESGASAIEFIKINEGDWLGLLGGSEKSETVPRAIGEIPSSRDENDEEEGKPAARALDAYYNVIKVAIAVEIKFSRITALLEQMEKSPIVFRFFALDAAKIDLRQKSNYSTISFKLGDKWKVKRDGEDVETAALAAKFSDIWNEAEITSVLGKKADFGEHPETRKVVIPDSLEMIEEPPVRLVLLYEALEFAAPKGGSNK